MKRHKFLLLLISAMLLSGCDADTGSSQNVPPKGVINLMRRTGKIDIDGKLTEKIWQRKADVERFYIYGGTPENFKPVATKAYFAIDDRFIYAGVRCEEPFMEKLKLTGKKTDDPIWKDDSVELFFVPSAKKSSYVQIVINADGVVFDLYQKEPGVTQSDLAWNSKTIAKTFKGKNFWSFEAAIPLENLPVDAPVSDWKFHVARNRAWKGELYSFVEGIKSFHDTEAFFTLPGVRLPHIKLTVQDYDPGECKYGINRARVVLKNWSSSPVTAQISAKGVKQTAPVAPNAEKVVHLDWKQPFNNSRCDQELVISEGKRILRRLIVKKDLKELFIDERHAVYAIEPNKVIPIALPLNLASLSEKNAQVRWEIRNQDGQMMVSGITSPRNGRALLRVFWSFMSPGSYKLSLEFLFNGKVVSKTQRDLRLVNSPFQGI